MSGFVCTSTPIRNPSNGSHRVEEEFPSPLEPHPTAPLLRRSPRLTTVPREVAKHLSPLLINAIVSTAVPLPQVHPKRKVIREEVIGKPKSHEDIVRDRNQDLPSTWPHGPWVDRYKARDEFNGHFHPRFAVKLDSYKNGTSKSGRKVNLLCHNYKVRGDNGEFCKMKIGLEDSTDGWVVSNFSMAHNHGLLKSNAEALAHASLRSIPEDLHTFGVFLKQAGMSPAEILKYVQINIDHMICYHCL